MIDFLRIKNLVKQNGDKFIFIENGEPEMVMMSFSEYQKLIGHGANGTSRNVSDENHHGEHSNFPAERTNEMTESLESAPEVGLSLRLEDIRLEDLPI